MGTFTEVRKNYLHNQEVAIHGLYTFGSAYAVGGDSLDIGLQRVSNVYVQPGPGGMVFQYDLANKKLKALRGVPADMVYSSAGLAIGSGSKKKILIANTVNYTIAGVWAAKTTAEIDFTATTHDIPADAGAVQEAVYLLSITGGTVTVTMGEIASGAGNAVIPAAPANQAVLGYVRIAVAAGSTPFDATSDDLDAAHITDTYVNLAYGPANVPVQLQEMGAGADVGTLAGAIEITFFGK